MGNVPSAEVKNRKRRKEFDWLNKAAADQLQDNDSAGIEVVVEESGQQDSFDSLFDSTSDDADDVELVSVNFNANEEGTVRTNLQTFIGGMRKETTNEECAGEVDADQTQEQEQEQDQDQDQECVGHSYNMPASRNAYVLVHAGPKIHSRAARRKQSNKHGSTAEREYDFSCHQPLK